MYILCIKILPRYVMLVQTRNFDIYVHHDIMCAFLFLRRLVMCNVLCVTKSDLEGTYTSPLGGSICAYVGRLWRSIIHLTLSETGKSLRSCNSFKR